MPAAFVVLYAGSTVASARVVAASSDPDLVAAVSGRLLREPVAAADPAAAALERGRRGALRLIQKGAVDAARG
jgi:hypothetical protein